MSYRGLFAAVLLLVACGDDNDPLSTATVTATTAPPTTNPTTNNPTTAPTSSDPGTTTGDPTTGTTGPVEGAPVILSLSKNVTKITEGESVIFTAMVTDPDGLDDLVGGSLLSMDESIDYGPFVAAGQPGTYSLTLSWAQIHQADPISFEDSEPTRTFVARFFDQKGNKATVSTDVTLTCVGGSACAGACTDLATDGANCGSCGRACGGGADACASGECAPAYGACVDNEGQMVTCAEVCQAAGETCVTHGCQGEATALFFDDLDDCMTDNNVSYGLLTCDEVHEWSINSNTIRCCCTDTK